MDTPKNASLRTIADVLGLHPSTVSRALRDPKSGRISAKTVERIRQVAEDHGYAPNAWAKSLREKRSMMVGLTMPRLTDTGLAQMFESAQHRALQLGYHTVLVANERETAPDEMLRSLLDGRTDGLIISTSTRDPEMLDRLAATGVQFVLLNRSSGDHPGVFSDDVRGARIATEHLISLGHLRIAHLAGPEHVSTGYLRIEGYRQAMDAAGLDIRHGWIGETNLDIESARSAARTMLSAEDRPTAIFAANDTVALAAMSVARELGIRVPEDLSFVGYNDSEFAELLPIPLTSVHVPIAEMGTAAVDMLVRKLSGEEVFSIVLTPKLVKRQSSTSPGA